MIQRCISFYTKLLFCSGFYSDLRIYPDICRVQSAKVEMNRHKVDYSYLTDMLEYSIHDLPVNADGIVEIPVKTYEIITIWTNME